MTNQQRKKLKLYAGIVLVVLLLLFLALQQSGIDMSEVTLPAASQSSAQHELIPASSDNAWEEYAESAEESAEETSQTGETLQVYFLDVGQGDSQLIRVPEKDGWWNMLIDTGEYAYADGLTDSLRALGVERIDALVNTHQHTDHMGCMARIVQRFDIGAVYMPELPETQVPTTSAYTALLQRLEEKNLTAVPLCEGTVIDCPDTVKLTVVASDPNANWTGLNNYSGVIRLVWGSTSFLFTGDAEKESEQVMLYSGNELKADVLKVGHHGSSTSSSSGFLDAVDPQYAVISCGRDNPYGHPHRETRAALSERNIKTYRTDEDGTILAESDGSTVSFTTGLPSIVERTW